MAVLQKHRTVSRQSVTVTISMPWWWRLYLGLALTFYALGFEIDTDKVGATIAKHSRYRAEDTK